MSAIYSAAPVASAEDVVARIERLPVSWWHVKTRIIVGTATFFDAFDALAIASVLPVIVPMWKLTPPQIGLLISAGFLGQLLGALFFGWIAERYGRVTGMVWSIATFAIMSLVCASAWNYESFLVFRLIQGFGLGGEVPIAAVYISELAKSNTRGRFVMLYELVFPVGIVAASLLGLWVVPTLGWQYMFVIGAIPAVMVLFLRRVLPEIAALAGHHRAACRGGGRDLRNRAGNGEGDWTAVTAAPSRDQSRRQAGIAGRSFRSVVSATDARRLADLVHLVSGELRSRDLDADGLSHGVQTAARGRAAIWSHHHRDRICRCRHRGSDHRSNRTEGAVRRGVRRCGSVASHAGDDQ